MHIKDFIVLLITVALSITSFSCKSNHFMNIENNTTNTEFKLATDTNTAVIAIGVETSPIFGACPGASVDANRMFNLLRTNYSSSGYNILLLNSSATKENVTNALICATNPDKNIELCIFYYSGHGGSVPQTEETKANYKEETGEDQFLCLYDMAMLDDEIFSYVENSPDIRFVFVFDCCHSKTMFRSPDMKNLAERSEKINNEKIYKRSVNNVRLLAISGCPDTTYSYGDSNGGIMTNGILRHFNNASSSKKKITYKDLFNALRTDEQVKMFEEVQLSELGTSFKDYPLFR